MVSLYWSRLRGMAARCPVELLLALALGSGALLPIQANMNAQLGRSLGSVPLAADLSYLTGAPVLWPVAGLAADGGGGAADGAGHWPD